MIQTMRRAGLSIQDAAMLERDSSACNVNIGHPAVNRKRRKTCKYSGFAVPVGEVGFGGRIRRTWSLAKIGQLVRNQ